VLRTEVLDALGRQTASHRSDVLLEGRAKACSLYPRRMRRSAPVTWTEFTTHDDGPLIAGPRAGSGPPVLLLHGGPGHPIAVSHSTCDMCCFSRRCGKQIFVELH